MKKIFVAALFAFVSVNAMAADCAKVKLSSLSIMRMIHSQ